jgi:hypothetical protein
MILINHMRIRARRLRTIISFFAVALIFWGGTGVAFAAQEKIDSFDSVIKMNADSSIDVEETILYDVGSRLVPWIHHNIPVRYLISDRGGEKYTLRLSEVSVTDAYGNPYAFVISDSGGSKKISIGGSGTAPDGKKAYIIRYHLEYPLSYHDTYDEMFWNVTSDDWTVPIREVSARVIYPSAIRTGGEDSRIECYAGRRGSRRDCDQAKHVFAGAQDGKAGAAEFLSSELGAGEGMAIVVAVPKGMLKKPNFLNYLGWVMEDLGRDFTKDGWVMILPLLILIRMLLIWHKGGRDPKGRETIIPEYDIPDGLTPAELGIILDERCGQKEIVAEMIFLAERGYIRIERAEGGDYVFRRLKDPANLENEFDRELMQGIFMVYGETKLSKLKGKFIKAYGGIVNSLFQSVHKKGYFSENPHKVISRYSMWAIFLLFGLMFFLYILAGMADAGLELPFSSNFTLFTILSVILSIFVLISLARIMPKKTHKGVAIREHILGFREYLRVVEKERLEFHNAPGEQNKDFEKLLSYAIALGVDEEWARQFDGLCEPPSSRRKKRSFISRKVPRLTP